MSSFRWFRMQQLCTTLSCADSSSPGSAATAADEIDSERLPADESANKEAEELEFEAENFSRRLGLGFFSFSGAAKRVCASKRTFSCVHRKTRQDRVECYLRLGGLLAQCSEVVF